MIDAALPRKSCKRSSLCNLCVLCVSVVTDSWQKLTTETQRTQRLHREIRRQTLMIEFAGGLFDCAAKLDHFCNVFPETMQLAHSCDSWILEKWTVDETLHG